MNRKIKKLNAFSGHSPLLCGDGGHSPLLNGDEGTQGSPRLVKRGVTLAEVLITLGVIGVVAAVTMPTLVTNIQEKVRKEQVRTVKYKFTKATDKMNSLGKIGHYDSTMDFVNELKKHLTIAKICQNNELDKCWPSESINAYSGSGSTLTEFPVKDLKKGVNLKALALGTKTTETVGIVTGDGVPMLLVYSPVCSGFDEAKTYTWSVDDGKPVTNATTNCISAIFDINGAKGPNRVGQDIRTLNSLFGSIDLGAVSVTKSECEAMIKNSKYGVKECYYDTDYWAGGVKKCADMGLHLPDMQTLANIANSRYGTTQIGPYTAVFNSSYKSSNGTGDCKDWIRENWGENHYYFSEAEILCGFNTSTAGDSALNNGEGSTSSTISGIYWSSSEASATLAYGRSFYTVYSYWYRIGGRYESIKSLCVGD